VGLAQQSCLTLILATLALPNAPEPAPASANAWREFEPGLWQRDVNARWFILRGSFVADISPAVGTSHLEGSVLI
jgi:hypothetical protein